MTTIVLTKTEDCSKISVCETVMVTEQTVFTVSGQAEMSIIPPGSSQTNQINVKTQYIARTPGDYIVCLRGNCKAGEVCTAPVLPMPVEVTPEPTGGSCDDPTFVKLCTPTEITDLLQAILDKDDIQVDTEYVCNEDTNLWERHTIVSTNGIPSAPVIVATSTPCSDPAPVMQDPEIAWVDNCVNGVIEKQLYQVQFIDNIAQPAVAIGAPIVTNIECGQDIITVDTEFNCNTDTNVYDMVQITTTNGIPDAPVVTPTLTPCDEDKPDFEQPRVCRNGTVHILTNQIDSDGTVTELSAIDTGEVCTPPVKQTVDVEGCDGATSSIDIDQEVVVRNVVTTKPCPVDTVMVDTEFVCNETTDVYNMVQITTTNGIAAPPVTTPTATPCDEDQPDFEQVRICRAGFINIVTNQIDEDGTQTELTAVVTAESCADPIKQTVDVNDCDLNSVPASVDSVVKVEGVIQAKLCPEDVTVIDVEYVCNTGTDVLDKIVHKWVNAVAEPDVVTPSTYACDAFRDIEYRRVCNPLTNKIDIVAVAFDEDDVETVLSTTAGTLDCKQAMKPDCVESQEYTFAIDNTGTDWRWDAEYELEWSDGRITPFSQVAVPAADNWSGQMANQWEPNLQAALVANQIGADVTVRFRDNGNLNNIAGIPAQGAAPAIAGPSSEYISNNLGAIGWRYINIQICLGQPLPVDFRLVNVSNVNGGYTTTTPRSLINEGPILGDLKKFLVCRECGEEPVWFLSDGVTPAQLGEIPICYEPCGTVAQSDSPAKPNCTFESAVGCDDVNGDGTNVVPDITRIFKICADSAPELFGYFETINNASVPYDIGGRPLVDCDTLEPIGEPTSPCLNFELTTLFKMEGDSELNGELRNREWHNSAPVGVLTSDESIATPQGRAFYDNHDFSLPPTTISTRTNLLLDDTNNAGVLLDIQIIDGLVEVKKGGWFRYSGPSEGYWAVWIAQCCIGEKVLVAENGGFSPDRTMEFYLPKGTHDLELVNIDSGGSNSSATFGYSTDNRATWINDNTPPTDIITFGSNKLEEVCVTVKICEDTGEMFDALTGDTLDASDLYTCSRMACTPASPIPEEAAIQTGVSEIEVCADGNPAIKKLTIVDGVEVETFIGADGLVITPTEWRAGSCTKSSECIKWRNKYVGIDNTGTSFTTEEVIEVSDADGVVGTFTISPSTDNTDQLNKWIAEIQLLYPNALIEQRYAPNGGAGLPAPNDEITWGMAARYVQFTACDGDDLPTSLRIIERDSVAVDQQMAVEVFLGKEQRGYVCYTCGEEPVLFYSDGTPIPDNEKPPCYILCAEPFVDDGDDDIKNSHLIEGCITIAGEKVSHYTIVDDNGDALFPPRPLTDIGFDEDCC